MKTIIITGPSGSGKTNLTNKLIKLFDNTIVINTDSYYRDSILIKFLSIFKYDIYDRTISIKKKEIENTLNSIYNQSGLISLYSYDFKRKKSLKTKIKLVYNSENQFVILEGIFSHRLDINYKDTINILCEEDKKICFKRRLKRDQIERGRNINEVNRKFSKSWNLFHNNIKNYKENNNLITINPVDKISYDQLIFYLNNIFKNKKTKKNK